MSKHPHDEHTRLGLKELRNCVYLESGEFQVMTFCIPRHRVHGREVRAYKVVFAVDNFFAFMKEQVTFHDYNRFICTCIYINVELYPRLIFSNNQTTLLRDVL